MLVLKALFWFVIPVLAQEPAALDRLYPGYNPTVFQSYSEIEALFQKMPLGFKMGGFGDLTLTSQCFQRAELWSYDFHLNFHIEAMKVFIFYTHTFREEYYRIQHQKFDWWFHVAPYVLLRNPYSSSLQEFVLDPTFAQTPLTMKDWTDLFVETKMNCAEFVPFLEFRNQVEKGPDATYGKEHCFIVRVPATDFDPTDLEAREKNEKTGFEWDSGQLYQSVNHAPSFSKRSWWRNRLGL